MGAVDRDIRCWRYHLLNLKRFDGCGLKDIWMPNVPAIQEDGSAGLGCTYQQWQGVKAEIFEEMTEQGLEVDEHGPDVMDAVLARLNPPPAPEA